MSPYPPFPIFTFIGFFIHLAVFFAIAVRFLKRWQSSTFMYLGCAALADSLNFLLVLVLFFAFPNTLTKANIFLFNALVIKPLVSIFAIMALMSLGKKTAKFAWVFFAIALAVVFLLYWQTFQKFQIPPVEFAYVHPVYPKLVTASEASGTVGAWVLAIFFLYHAFSGTMIMRRRALVLASAMFLLGISSLYWISVEPVLYILTHAIGPLGSLLLAAGIFMFQSKETAFADGDVVL